MKRLWTHQNQINVGPISAYENGSNLALLHSPSTHRASTHRLLRNLALQSRPKRSLLSLCATMVGPVRSATEGRTRRPPNSWIIYRSEKVREMYGKNSDQPRKVQAEVSKEISQRWRNEPAEVRAHYERLADEEKTQHQLKFPDYRFQPMKKEEKERLKEERKLTKERERANSKKGRGRQQPYPTTHPLVPMHTLPAQAQDKSVFSSIGPPPPLSIASTPIDPTVSLEPQVNDGHRVPASSDASIPIHSGATDPSNLIARPPVTAPSFGPLFPQYLFPHQVPIQSPVEQLPTPAPSQWDIQSPWPLYPSVTPFWPESLNPTPAPGGCQPQDFLTFNVPSSVPQAITDWGQGASGSDTLLEDLSPATIAATDDPGIYQFANLQTEDICVTPQGEIEVSMGQMLRPASEAFDIDDFDFTSFLAHIQSEAAEASPQDSSLLMQDLSTLFLESSAQRDFGLSDNSIFQYVDLDSGLKDEDPSITAYPTPSPQHDRHVSNSATCVPQPQSSTYTPPAGAIFSSTRRVAASWKPAFATQSELSDDHNLPRQHWRVPTS